MPAFIIALASLPICRPVSCQSDRLKLIPVVIGNANLVVCVFRPDATPVEASDHLSAVRKKGQRSIALLPCGGSTWV